MKRLLLCSIFLFSLLPLLAQKEVTVKKKDRKKDILLQTNYGDITLRLSDSTPLHRDNFIKLVKSHYYDSVLFHRVINRFMIQAGDGESKGAPAGKPLGNGKFPYTIPAEIRPGLFHERGVLAAARMGDDVNPRKESSGSQFYIVQGKVFTDAGLDSVETNRLKRKIPAELREIYKTVGGTPHLDQNYTVYGKVVKGLEVVDQIAVVETSKGPDKDRPVKDVVIIKAKLVKRKKIR
ncbi:peptidylprolyl isomerase [Terrimonas sp. NA20]|uniref:Peptidyl-prolyl cis-trans isomerase n=1 Tax=Terrimonas ginsenosidimutans TaxID=2908004 RepID=A0ABS9KQ72_9BACT|nr:peptidylprolyl isomerase [Terrimonas ginsenosidimutans]MCG2614479.1 peptidylprolyl isomerase [Terrimonas ginsenosidimutans]